MIDLARTDELVRIVIDAPDDEQATTAIIFRVLAEDFVAAARQLHAARAALTQIGQLADEGLLSPAVQAAVRAVLVAYAEATS